MSEQTAIFLAVILAGERPGGSPLSHAFNIPASVMVPVAGKPALAHVMHAIKNSHQVNGGIICGPAADVIENCEELKSLLQDPEYEWLEPAMGPTASALSALEKLDHFPVLLTSGDHALLTSEIVDDFCKHALFPGSGRSPDKSAASPFISEPAYDLVIGFVPYALVQAAWPASKRTVLKFSNGQFCGSNLIAVLSPEGRRALDFWRHAEALRKHPWKIAWLIGPVALLRYLFGRVTVKEALRSLSAVAGCRIGYVQVNFARAAVDVDSIDDQKLAEKIMSSMDDE